MQERALPSWAPDSTFHQPFTGLRFRPGAENVSTRQSTSLEGMEHDLGNLMTALRLCADLIAEPGALSPSHAHLADELSALTTAAERLTCGACGCPETSPGPVVPQVMEPRIENLGQTVRDLGPLMAAVAGPRVDVQIASMPCPGELGFSEESLSRVLLNLVRNASDAMPSGGWIRITVQRGGSRSLLSAAESRERAAADYLPGAARRRTALLTVEDNGSGIDPELLERIFEPGFSTRHNDSSSADAAHRGVGLSTVRQLIEEAGGIIIAQNRPAGGARFLIELPLTNVTPCLPPEPVPHGLSGAL